MEEEVLRLPRTRNATRNIVTGIVNKTVIIVLPFVIRTLIIYALGIEYTGLNGLFSSVLEVLNLSELGFSSAVVYSLYSPIAKKDEETVCSLLNFYRKVYVFIGVFILCIGLLLMPFIKYLIKGSYPNDINIYWLFFIFLFNSSLSYWFLGYKAVLLNAYQRVDILFNISTIANGILYVCQIIVLVFCKNYYYYILLMPCFTIINNLIIAKEVKRLFPQYRCQGKLSNEIKKDIKKKIFALMIGKINGISRNSLDNIFISAFMGLTYSAIYSNYYSIMSSIISVLGIITGGMQAGVGNSIQTESEHQNYLDLKRFTFMYMWLAGWCTICLICLFQPFMALWVGADKLLPFSAMILLCMYFYILKMGDIQSIYFQAVGLWWEGKHLSLIEAAANLILNFWLVHKWGIHGIILATVMTLFFMNFFFLGRVTFRHYFKCEKWTEYFKDQLKYILVTVFACSVTYYLCRLWSDMLGTSRIECLTTIVKRSILCLVVPNGIYFCAYRKSKLFYSTQKWLLNRRVIKK